MGKATIQSKSLFAGPLYVQVADMLRERIEELEWRPDLPMPNESQLAKEFSVSIGTMRKALDALEAEKFIRRKQGRGTFVVDSNFEGELARFVSLYRVDLIHDAKLASIEKSRRLAGAEEVARLGLDEGGEVVEIARVRQRAGVATTFERIVIPAEVFEGIEEIENLSDPLLFAIYRRDFHIVVGTANETILPFNADGLTAQHLGVEPGVAVLKISRLAISTKGEPIEWSVRYVHISTDTFASASVHATAGVARNQREAWLR